MKYLISAYSVNPYKGSEDSIGWNWVLQFEKNYKDGDEIILLTKKYNENDTKKGLREFGIKNVKLAIVDVPNILNWFREKHSMFHHMYYILWQHQAWRWVKKSGIQFDVIHHVTMNDYRVPSELYKQKRAKVIWGPIGGAQVTPKALREYEDNKPAAWFREMVNKSCSWNPFYKKSLRAYDKIYCINNETKKQIEAIVHRNIELLPELALRDEYKNIKICEHDNEIFEIVFVGRIIGKKGISFLIDTLTMLPKEFKWKLYIYGDGNKRQAIEKKIATCMLGTHIELMGNRSLAQISEAYKKADLFVLPSLRETSGNVLLESMAYAIPIVALDTSFCSILNRENCGIFINVDQSLEKIKNDFKDAILKLSNDKQLRKKLGENGYKFVNKKLTWELKYKQIYK